MASTTAWGALQDPYGRIDTPRWIATREMVKREAVEDRIEDVCESIGSKLLTIEEGWRVREWRGQLELHTRFLWQCIFDAARFCDKKHKDRLVVQVMLIHGMGDMIGTEVVDFLPTTERAVVASTSKGVLWSDMPFFVEDMTRLWTLEGAIMSRTQRRNLSAVLATLGGIGLDDKLCGIGIIVLRETFETPREQGSGDAPDTEDADRTMDAFTVMDLFDDCAGMWMRKCRDRFKRLSERGFSDFPPEVGRVGPLAKEAGVPDTGGFSLKRLDFWIRKSGEIYAVKNPNRRVGSQVRWPDDYF
ncbi:hypothetical protein F5Y11DRAFT_318178 [Daldinia sp. FL1419]|nr:hypothetical protein F5Y11DRAFT_318178 [Daldinia sp. FL1419]